MRLNLLSVSVSEMGKKENNILYEKNKIVTRTAVNPLLIVNSTTTNVKTAQKIIKKTKQPHNFGSLSFF